MPTNLPRPLLIGSLSLTLVTLLVLQGQRLPLWSTGILLMGLAVLVGLARKSPISEALVPAASIERVQQALARAETLVEQLTVEAPAIAAQSQFLAKVKQITADLARPDLHLAIAGGKSVGKTALYQLLQAEWLPQHPQVALSESPALFTGNAEATNNAVPPQPALTQADLVLFLIQGDITQPEFECLCQLVNAKKRTLLVLNKQDQYLPPQRLVVLQQIQERMRGQIDPEDILAITAHPNPTKVRRHQRDGSCQEWVEATPPQVSDLVMRLDQVMAQDAQQLIWQQGLQQALALQIEVQTQLNQSRRDRALEIIERYQWICAATTLANPLTSLDLLATAAINTQMVIELGSLYQLKLSWAQAQAITQTLASLMLKFGLVEFSTQTLGALLKGNVLTYVAGGVIQGVSAAYLTRLAGLSLIEHFQVLSTQSTGTWELPDFKALSQTVQVVFQQNQRLDFLKSLLQQGLSRFFPQNDSTATLPAATTESVEPTPLHPATPDYLGAIS